MDPKALFTETSHEACREKKTYRLKRRGPLIATILCATGRCCLTCWNVGIVRLLSVGHYCWAEIQLRFRKRLCDEMEEVLIRRKRTGGLIDCWNCEAGREVFVRQRGARSRFSTKLVVRAARASVAKIKRNLQIGVLNHAARSIFLSDCC